MKEELATIRDRARQILQGICRVCPDCDGRSCVGKVPGMGARGSGFGFRRNTEALKKIMLNLRTMHNAVQPDTRYELFGAKLEFPIIGAPMCETTYNFLSQIEDGYFIDSQVGGAGLAGTMAFTGDSMDLEVYKLGLQAIRNKLSGRGIVIIKPRETPEIIKRIKLAEEYGVLGVGIDIDAAGFDVFNRAGQPVGPINATQLRKIISSTALPVVLKGIMTADEAIKAAHCGAAAIVVSNHGGRALDYTPGTAEVLPEISAAVSGSLRILMDSGIRSGEDVLKALALGAEAVLVGRPIAIAAVGGGEKGVKLLFQQYKAELTRAMLLTGCKDLASIGPHVVRISKR